ncbi:hypothetical protein D3C80_1058680 [compost metagenome]
MALAAQRHHQALALARQQAAQARQHQVPVAQQVEAHHRNQQQIADPGQQRQARGRDLRQQHAGDVARLAEMLGEQRLEPIQLPEVGAQAKLLLDPGQRRHLQPVEHLRHQFVQAQQLPAEQRHQHQQQDQQDQAEQAEHRHHPPGARQSTRLQAVNQRIAQIGEQYADQERHQDWLQLVNQPAKQDHGRQPQPAAGIAQHARTPFHP